MSENYQLYRQFVDYYYGEIEVTKEVFEVTKSHVISSLAKHGISKATKDYLYRRKFDRTKDYMLDASDAMQSYYRRSNPSYKHICAVLLEGVY